MSPDPFQGVSPGDAMPKVLFVDDDLAILVAFPRMLRRQPYEVLVAPSAAAALAILECEAIDVVVSDQQMPGMRGTELLAQVQSLYPHIVRMILTGEPGTHAENDLADACVHKVLRKPASPGEITGAIVDALRKLLNR
jgi:response regulator RpfG family c-di-GMP phosphodiesterase